ncbi:MAG: ABC transporter ATP-binding protein [Clostridia bacterium]|nr:ABC transporter ATP-binding protein [Clostridia bacterium]
MADTLVRMKDVSFVYHDISGENKAVADLNLDVKSGEFISIVGPSGCGKTTVLSMLSGIITPTSGTIEVNSKQIGYMLQRDHLLDWRTIEDNVFLSLQVKGLMSDETKRNSLELLRRYDLYSFKDSYPRQLSGGMRQKVALIRTLAFSPSLLLLDEPFSALDFHTRLKLADEIYDIIRKEKKTAILVTHDISEAISMSERVLVFSKRPAHVKSEYKMNFTKDTPPFMRRSDNGFKDCFDMIWSDIDDEENNNT